MNVTFISGDGWGNEKLFPSHRQESPGHVSFIMSWRLALLRNSACSKESKSKWGDFPGRSGKLARHNAIL